MDAALGILCNKDRQIREIRDCWPYEYAAVSCFAHHVLNRTHGWSAGGPQSTYSLLIVYVRCIWVDMGHE